MFMSKRINTQFPRFYVLSESQKHFFHLEWKKEKGREKVKGGRERKRCLYLRLKIYSEKYNWVSVLFFCYNMCIELYIKTENTSLFHIT